jgi:hypothetical protein
MTDDRNAARRAAAEELREGLRFMRAAGLPAELVLYDQDGDCDLSGCPAGDGEGMFIPVTIGARGNLSKAEARRGAAMWRQATGRYPEACFMISLLGYNEDPREVWEFRDARRYVRWWARFAGLDDPAVADQWLGASSAIGRGHARAMGDRRDGASSPLAACSARSCGRQPCVAISRRCRNDGRLARLWFRLAPPVASAPSASANGRRLHCGIRIECPLYPQ